MAVSPQVSGKRRKTSCRLPTQVVNDKGRYPFATDIVCSTRDSENLHQHRASAWTTRAGVRNVYGQFESALRPNEPAVPQVPVLGPLQELDPRFQFRSEPPAILHLVRRQAFAPSPCP
jgi:hypothetical protein